MHKILFICHGNICRSPMAEFVLKDRVKKLGLEEEFEIASRATSREEIGNDVYPPVKRLLKEKGVACEGHKATQITEKDAEHFDLLIFMDENNKRNLERLLGQSYVDKMKLFLQYAGESKDIADPWYTGNFTDTWDDVNLAMDGLLKSLELE